jgi:alkylation response protein AidB-like acyl-CoA dehydrogenase
MDLATASKMPDIPVQPSAKSEFTAMLDLIGSQRSLFTERQSLTPEVVEALKRTGIYRALVAKRFGGDERPPSEFLEMIEAISRVDASAGWVASFGFSSVYLAALPLSTLESMYRETPDVVFAGGIYPPQKACRAGAGYKVSGRWSWGSGCTGADLIGVGIQAEGQANGPLPLIAVMPRSEVTIQENWDVNGLKGTGSHDIVVDNVFVPEEWTFVRGGRASLTSPLYRYPSMALAAQVLAVVALGAARSAIDTLIDVAGGRKSITGSPTLAERAYVQSDIAKAEARLRSARAFFFEATEEAFAALESADTLDQRRHNDLRLASSNAARTGADVSQMIYTLSGTTGIFTAHPIAQSLQDAMVVPQHAFLSEGTWQSAGRLLLGLPPTPGFP